MDRRKRVKKNVDVDPNQNQNGERKPSSLYWTRSRKEAQDPEIGQVNLTRKRKKDYSSKSQDQNKAAAKTVTEGPINDLPPEMLTKILKYVDSLTLFDCRLVSRKWNEISSGILTQRPDIMLTFEEYESPQFDSSRRPVMYKSEELEEFVNLMKESEYCPFASFYFDVDSPSFFDEDDWIGFLSIFAPSNPNQNQRAKIKSLYLKFETTDNAKKLRRFTEKLRDLLNKIPGLEELGLGLFSFYSSDSIKLFPPKSESGPTTRARKSTDALSASALVPGPVQLPCLKVVEFEADMFEDFPGIVEDLLNAAINLTRIQVVFSFLTHGGRTIQIFEYLHSLGKLHLLKIVELCVSENFLSALKNSTRHEHLESNFLLGFKLHELNLIVSDIGPTFYVDATNFISTLLESNKDTLEELQIPPLGFLHELQFPKFTKLRTLELVAWGDADDDDDNGHNYDNDDDNYDSDDSADDLNHVERGQQFFPLETRATEIFAAVDHLSITTKNWQCAFPQEDSIPIFSSVSTLCFSDDELVEENVITKLGLMCPNLKHCVIQTLEGNPEQFNFSRVGRSIWTHLDQLESLEVDLDVNLENHAFPALDSCFTGISPENCQALEDLMEAEKTRKKSKSQVKLPESEEFKTLTKREHPSILDMKNLKKLVINPHSGKRQHEGKNFFSTKITWVSEEFAFKFMPHLQFNGRRPSANS